MGIDDAAVLDTAELHRALDSKQPGEQITVRVQRDGEKLALPLLLGSRAADPK